MTSVFSRLAQLERVYAEPAPPPAYRAPVALAARAGFTDLDPWQAEVLESAAPRLLLNCCRQSGKSTITAILAAHVALYEPGALVLCLSPTERQSGELLRKVVDVYAAAGRPVPAESERRLALELENGARVLALPGAQDKTVRGLSAPRLVLLDEAARIDDALWHAVSPMVAVSQGRVILLSTPFGQRGTFFQLWTEGGDRWQRIEIHADQVPRITPAFLAEERATLPSWVFNQEYCGKFEAAEDSVFAYADVQAALSAAVAPLW